jgi:hypothetical protein
LRDERLQEGFITKSELKWNINYVYPSSKSSSIVTRNYYLSLQYLHKSIDYKKEQKRVKAMHIKGGIHYFYQQNHILDLYLGIGLRGVKQTRTVPHTNGPNMATQTKTMREDVLPSLSAGFRYGIGL